MKREKNPLVFNDPNRVLGFIITRIQWYQHATLTHTLLHDALGPQFCPVSPSRAPYVMPCPPLQPVGEMSSLINGSWIYCGGEEVVTLFSLPQRKGKQFKFRRLESFVHDSWRQERDKVRVRRLEVKPRALEVPDKHSLAFVIRMERYSTTVFSESLG